MSARIRPLVPGDLTSAQSALRAAITGGPRARGPQHFALSADDGSLRGPFDLMLRSPAVGTAMQELGAAIRYRTELPDRMREFAILLVATRWDCAFEREAHEAIARAIGIDEAALAAIHAEEVSAFAGVEGMTGRVVVALLDGDLSDELWAEASDLLGIAAVFELTALVGYYSMLALQLRVFRVA